MGLYVMCCSIQHHLSLSSDPIRSYLFIIYDLICVVCSFSWEDKIPGIMATYNPIAPLAAEIVCHNLNTNHIMNCVHVFLEALACAIQQARQTQYIIDAWQCRTKAFQRKAPHRGWWRVTCRYVSCRMNYGRRGEPPHLFVSFMLLFVFFLFK